jgi:RNA polymerase sigma factor (sigma-70 family)
MLPAADRSHERAAEDTTFAAFYRRELPGQVRRATLLLGDNATAQDLVHDAFADVFSRWGSLRDAGPYLSTTVLNRCRDHGRRNVMSDRRLRLLLPEAGPDDELLWDAVQQLPFNHRAVVVLRFYHRMTDAEIATTLDCRPGSVGPWLQRALRRLRKDLT